MITRIYGFNVKIVNVFSPTESDESENKKESFYRLLNKACIKSEKHQKLIIAGEFNAKTSLAFQSGCYDGTTVIPDEDCNDNGTRLKNFCRINKLCIASTYFNYSTHQKTGTPGTVATKRINNYVLTERFLQ